MLLNSFMQGNAIDADSLELKAEPGESFLVKDVMVDNTSDVEFAKVMIDRMTVGYFSVYNMYTNQLIFAKDKAAIPTILEFLRQKELFAGYPIATGQKLLVDITGATTKNIRVMYERYDEGDIKAEAPNGTKSKEYTFVNYGTNKAAHDSGTYALFDKTLNPAEFPDFPFGAVVPAGIKMSILGILIPSYRKAVNIGAEYRYLRLMKGRETLWDKDKAGIYVTHGLNYFPWGDENSEYAINLLPEPLVFLPGEELTVEISIVTGDVGACGAEEYLIGFITKVEEV